MNLRILKRHIDVLVKPPSGWITEKTQNLLECFKMIKIEYSLFFHFCLSKVQVLKWGFNWYFNKANDMRFNTGYCSVDNCWTNDVQTSWRHVKLLDHFLSPSTCWTSLSGIELDSISVQSFSTRWMTYFSDAMMTYFNVNMAWRTGNSSPTFTYWSANIESCGIGWFGNLRSGEDSRRKDNSFNEPNNALHVRFPFISLEQFFALLCK